MRGVSYLAIWRELKGQLVTAYNSIVVSVTSHVGQFVPPSARVLAVEHWCVQVLLKNTWQVVPSECARNLKLLGLSSEFASIALSCRAAMARTLASTAAFWPSKDWHEFPQQEEESLFFGWRRGWQTRLRCTCSLVCKNLKS